MKELLDDDEIRIDRSSPDRDDRRDRKGRDRERRDDRDDRRDDRHDRRDERRDDRRDDRRDEKKDVYIAPKLSDIAGGSYVPNKVIGTLDQSSINEDELKRELIFKFELLKRKYKEAQIPDFTLHSDYKNMQHVYQSTVRQLSIENNIETYKGYLILGFYIVEFVMGNYLKFDMKDFTKQQIVGMNKYEHLLIELGEKNYVPDGSKWPVEIRLLFTILIQTAMFIITKMVMSRLTDGLGGLFGGLQAPSAPPSQSSSSSQPPKRTMKGPNISLDDI